MGRLVKPAAEILAAAPATPEHLSTAYRSKVREWAIAYGFTNTPTGRFSDEVLAMYRALHPDGNE